MIKILRTISREKVGYARQKMAGKDSRIQGLKKIEPQNIEQGITNVEGKNLIIHVKNDSDLSEKVLQGPSDFRKAETEALIQ